MKRFWYKFLVCVLSLGMLYPTWIATGAQKAKAGTDTDAPYLSNMGFDADGIDMQYGPGNYYYLPADGNSATDHLLDFDALAAGNEPLAAGYYGLYLTGSQVSSIDLKQYYDDRGTLEPYLSYLKQGVDAVNPFAYIKCDGSADVDLIDAAKHDLASIDSDMVIPGDYPSGWYSVSTKTGEGFEDLAGNEGSISFNLIVDSTKPDITVFTPADSEAIAGASDTDYEITWIATDAESGIKANSIEIKYYDGSSWATLVSGLANTGSYSWTVPADTTSNAGKIRVIAHNNVNLKGKDTAKDLDIADRTAPVITLNGDQEISVLKGSTYSDSGATAIDNYDGDVTAGIDTTSNVDTSIVGEYKVTYDVDDAAGNHAVQVERIVKVINLSAAEGLAAISGDGEVSLSWNAVVGAVSYNVYYKKTSEVDYAGPVNVTSTSTKITGLENGLSYDFKVVAVNENGVGGESVVVTATPKSSAVVLASAPSVQDAVVAQPETPVVTPEVTPPTEETGPEVGQIKGEETTATEEEDINWTPWIILFVLIVLAGAATGGYFYWFGNEEEEIVSEKVIEKTRKSNGKKSSGSKPSAKKSKRW